MAHFGVEKTTFQLHKYQKDVVALQNRRIIRCSTKTEMEKLILLFIFLLFLF